MSYSEASFRKFQCAVSLVRDLLKDAPWWGKLVVALVVSVGFSAAPVALLVFELARRA
jgi:hypothetical protein